MTLKTMADAKQISWKYAPLWAVLFATVATLGKSLGQRYILKRTWDFKASDVATAAVGAVLGYLSFRFKHGDMHDRGPWYKR